MPYIYRVSRVQPVSRVGPQRATVVPAEEITDTAADLVEDEEPSYRELQAQAKAADIPANQSAEDLKKALAEANPDD